MDWRASGDTLLEFIPNPARHPFQGWRLGDQVRTLDALGRWM